MKYQCLRSKIYSKKKIQSEDDNSLAETLDENEEISQEEFEDANDRNFEQQDIENYKAEMGESKRGLGRPTLERTGKPGRPTKIYQTKRSEPRTPREALKRDEKES